MSVALKDARGSLQFLPNYGNDPAFRALYSVAAASVITGHDVVALNLAANPTAQLKLKRARVTLIGNSVVPTTAPITVKLAKRSALDTGGTLATAPTIVPVFAGNPATQAVVKAYTANPTDGTLIGYIAEKALCIDAQVSALANPVRVVDTVEFDLTEGGTVQPPTLSTAVEQLGIVIGAALPTSSTLVVEIVWDESPAGTF